MIDLKEIVERLKHLTKKTAAKPDLAWAIVTNAAPLTIRLDGDTTPLAGTAPALAANLRVGDRVIVALQGTRIIVVGRGGGDLASRHVTENQPTGRVYVGGKADSSNVFDTSGLYLGMDGAATGTADAAWFRRNESFTLAAFTADGGMNAPKLPYAAAANIVPAQTVPAASSVDVAVVFPPGRFTATPIVVVGLQIGARDINAYHSGQSATGFTLTFGSTSSVSRSGVRATWHAMQMSPTAGGG